MQFNLDLNRHSYTIRAYGPGSVTVTLPMDNDDPAPAALDAIGPAASRIRQEVITQSLIITPQQLIRDWPPQTLQDLAEDHTRTLAELGVEVVLLGCGARLQWPDSRVLAPLMRARVGYELMDTAAACRTYNILMSDGRRVAAALMMI
ncbi:MAG: Mth938-like domain-containing protein [Pseudomonadota bacterium]